MPAMTRHNRTQPAKGSRPPRENGHGAIICVPRDRFCERDQNEWVRVTKFPWSVTKWIHRGEARGNHSNVNDSTDQTGNKPRVETEEGTVDTSKDGSTQLNIHLHVEMNNRQTGFRHRDTNVFFFHVVNRTNRITARITGASPRAQAGVTSQRRRTTPGPVVSCVGQLVSVQFGIRHRQRHPSSHGTEETNRTANGTDKKKTFNDMHRNNTRIAGPGNPKWVVIETLLTQPTNKKKTRTIVDPPGRERRVGQRRTQPSVGLCRVPYATAPTGLRAHPPIHPEWIGGHPRVSTRWWIFGREARAASLPRMGPATDTHPGLWSRSSTRCAAVGPVPVSQANAVSLHSTMVVFF